MSRCLARGGIQIRNALRGGNCQTAFLCHYDQKHHTRMWRIWSFGYYQVVPTSNPRGFSKQKDVCPRDHLRSYERPQLCLSPKYWCWHVYHYRPSQNSHDGDIFHDSVGATLFGYQMEGTRQSLAGRSAFFGTHLGGRDEKICSNRNFRFIRSDTNTFPAIHWNSCRSHRSHTLRLCINLL